MGEGGVSVEGTTIAVGVVTGVPAGMLGAAGVQHLAFDREHRLLGAPELAAALAGVVALALPGALPVAVALFAVLAVAFLAHLARLWRTDRARSCGCTPLSTRVMPLSFLPAATLLATACAAALVTLAGMPSEGLGAARVVVFLPSALVGWSILLWPPAAER
jgi:hypothetical protein